MNRGVEPPRASATWRGDVTATLSLAWPLVLSNLAGTALGTIDVILVGQLGAPQLAAAALATTLYAALAELNQIDTKILTAEDRSSTTSTGCASAR